jgi:hypothetical protein
MSQIASGGSIQHAQAGVLLKPFGWAADLLVSILAAKPNLLPKFLEIDHSRMHLIALSLAHLDGELTKDLGETLVRGPTQSIVESLPTSHPSRLEGVLNQLPSDVLEPSDYRRLVALMEDDNAAKLLEDASFVSDSLIRALDSLPLPLRTPCIINSIDCIDLEYGLSDGLRLLVSRGAAPGFDALVSELGSILEEDRLCSKMLELLEALPLPTTFPPPQIDNACRIDHPAAIRSLAHTLNSDLDEYIVEVNAGRCALYLWTDSNFLACCVVTRCERLGWFLNSVNGSQNYRVDQEQLVQIRSAFLGEGFPRIQSIAAIMAMSRQAEIRNIGGAREVTRQYRADRYVR